jgi:AcrR family transcriptional regulator
MNRQSQLRDQALDYFLAHGVANLSLRPLAAAIGTSARLLVYHFGSKEDLIRAVMDEVRKRMQRSFAELMRSTGGVGSLENFWAWCTHPANTPHIRLLFEVQVLAMQNPSGYARYLETTSSSWLATIESVLPPSSDRRAKATLCAAVIDGLVLEYLATGDLHRTTQAVALFAALLGESTSRAPRAPSEEASS